MLVLITQQGNEEIENHCQTEIRELRAKNGLKARMVRFGNITSVF